MKTNSQIFLAGLMTSLFLPVGADYKPQQFTRSEKIEERSNVREEKKLTKDERKQQFLAKLGAGLLIAVAGGWISQREFLADTGADVGLVASTILMSLSCLLDGENAATVRSLAYAATPL